ncbi:creatininase [Arthrobacter sp. CAU 1506]|uniref:creatininase n=1 Tax=Arthrobacter sp. CAU 1506 TaxID=2560052 RepID=UPI0010AD6C6B|nr:creatininase [Arthrobacter sp. CAU 1506]TJY67530.1 creatininase [Arthrobacter sp. CAU 1506]
MNSQPRAAINPPSVHLSEIDAHTFAAWLDAGTNGVVLVPVGAMEQHGPHVPLGTDALLSTSIAAAVAETTGALVAQPVTYGYKSQQKSGGGNHLPGTTSLDAATLIGLTRCLTTSLFTQGARHVVFINGHFENYQFLYEGIDLALNDLGISSGDDRSVLLLSYWDYVASETLETVYPEGFPGWEIEHGGVLETSLMLHLQPGLVDMDRSVDHPPAALPKFDRLPVVPSRTPATGCLSSPAGSDADKGKLLFDQVVDTLAQDIARELRLKR